MPTSALDSHAGNQFVVGTLTFSGHTLVAHYAFDRFDDLGLDSFGHQNHIFAGAVSGLPEHDFSGDSTAVEIEECADGIGGRSRKRFRVTPWQRTEMRPPL